MIAPLLTPLYNRMTPDFGAFHSFTGTRSVARSSTRGDHLRVPASRRDVGADARTDRPADRDHGLLHAARGDGARGPLRLRWRRTRNPHTLEEWGVGGRAFGNWVTWFLIGGASYTAYTFVAVPSLTWGIGAFGFYAVPFALVDDPVGVPDAARGWSVVRTRTGSSPRRVRPGPVRLADAALLVAIIGIVATMPYIAVQMIALQAVFKVVGDRPASGRC